MWCWGWCSSNARPTHMISLPPLQGEEDATYSWPPQFKEVFFFATFSRQSFSKKYISSLCKISASFAKGHVSGVLTFFGRWGEDAMPKNMFFAKKKKKKKKSYARTLTWWSRCSTAIILLQVDCNKNLNLVIRTIFNCGTVKDCSDSQILMFFLIHLFLTFCFQPLTSPHLSSTVPNYQRRSTVPNHQRWCAKMEAQSEHICIAYTCFCTFPTDLYAQSVIINKISASELSRKFIKSALLVGHLLCLSDAAKQDIQSKREEEEEGGGEGSPFFAFFFSLSSFPEDWEIQEDPWQPKSLYSWHFPRYVKKKLEII